MSDKSYYVYILTNNYGTLYTGVTSDLLRRVWQDKQKLLPGVSKRYNLTRLVHYQETNDVGGAIAREKQIKGWVREKKVALIEPRNPHWTDLAQDWF